MWHAAANQGDLSTRVVHIREHRHLIAVRPLLRILLLLRLWLEGGNLPLLVCWRHL